MECKVALFSPKEKAVIVNFALTFDGSDVIINFTKVNQNLFAKYSIFAFNTFSVNEDDKKCILQTDSSRLVFSFNDDTRCLKFISLLSEKGILSPIPGKQCSFNISRPKSFPNLSGIVNNLFNIKNNSATQPNGLETGVIEASLPFAELAPLKKEDTINVKYSTLHFALLNISMNLYPDIIAGIFPPTNTTQPFEDYLKIKSQWQLITKSEWQHNCNMRIFVHDLEHWLGVRSKQHTEEYNRLFFNVSLTLFFSCFCELKFSEIFATFLEILCFTFIRKKQDKTAFYDSSGKLLTSDEAENWVFWRIKGLWRKITNIQTSELNDSLAIRSILLNISPPTLEMLNERNITSLSFATRNCVYQMFVKGRPKQDALLLVTAALASEDLVKFRQYAIAVALVLLQGKLEDLPNGDFELFSQMYTTEVQKINPRVLLYNVEKMFASFSE